MQTFTQPQAQGHKRGSCGLTIWLGTWALPACLWSRWCIQARGKCWDWWGCLSAHRLARGRLCRSAQCGSAAEAAYRTVEGIRKAKRTTQLEDTVKTTSTFQLCRFYDTAPLCNKENVTAFTFRRNLSNIHMAFGFIFRLKSPNSSNKICKHGRIVLLQRSFYL